MSEAWRYAEWILPTAFLLPLVWGILGRLLIFERDPDDAKNEKRTSHGERTLVRAETSTGALSPEPDLQILPKWQNFSSKKDS